MIYIAHRGNTDGPDSTTENTPQKLKYALERGYDCELDVWYQKACWWLGHDQPRIRIKIKDLKMPGVWCHAKNLATLAELLSYDVHCFFHDHDDGALTSRGYIWTYPGKPLTRMSIACLPEWTGKLYVSGCAGVCSDYIGKIRQKYEASQINK
jgi:hypothetical protein